MHHLASAMLVVVGIIHLIPVTGVLGAERLASLYGLPFGEPNIEILMRHRAVLFGLLGMFFIFAAFRPVFRTAAFVAGFISVVSFLWIAISAGSYNGQVGRVVTVDIVALICLVVGVVAYIHGSIKAAQRGPRHL